MSWSMTVRCELIQKGINALTEELIGINLL